MARERGESEPYEGGALTITPETNFPKALLLLKNTLFIVIPAKAGSR